MPRMSSASPLAPPWSCGARPRRSKMSNDPADDQGVERGADARALAEGRREQRARRTTRPRRRRRSAGRCGSTPPDAGRPTAPARRPHARSGARPSRTGRARRSARRSARPSRRAESGEGATPGHHGCAARRYAELAGQAAARSLRSRGKSGHRRAGCWVTPRRGNPTESATERTPPKRPSAVAGKGEKVR